MYSRRLPRDGVIGPLHNSATEVLCTSAKWQEHLKRLGKVASIGTLLFTGTGLIEAARFELEPTRIVAYGTSESHEIAAHNKICFGLSGYGLDLTEDYFRGLNKTLSPNCHMARVVYSNVGIKPEEIADKARDYINDHTDPSKEVDISVYAASMGGLVALQLGADLLENDETGKLNISWMVLDSTPSGSEDVKGLPVKAVAKIGSSVNQTSMPIYGLRTPAALVGEVGSRLLRHNYPDLTDRDAAMAYYNDVKYLTSMNEPRLANAQLHEIDTFKEPQKLEKLEILKSRGTPIFYLHAENPDRDEVVDVMQASRTFRRLLPGLTVMTIPGGRHADPNETPAYNAAVGNILKLTGSDTIETRVANYQRLDAMRHRLGRLAA